MINNKRTVEWCAIWEARYCALDIRGNLEFSQLQGQVYDNYN